MAKNQGKTVQTGTQTGNTTNQLDDLANLFRMQVFGAAGNLAGSPAPGLAGSFNDAQKYLGQYANLGLGAGAALGGDPNAIAQQMNPYMKNVIDATKQQFGDIANQTALGANDAATRAGAFGGSRHAVLMGEQLGKVRAAEGQTIAGQLQGGYENMMNRAFQTANLGMGAAGQLGQGGQFASQFGAANDPQMRAFQAWLAAAGGTPYGSQQSQTGGWNNKTTQTSGTNWLNTLGGLGLIGGGLLTGNPLAVGAGGSVFGRGNG